MTISNGNYKPIQQSAQPRFTDQQLVAESNSDIDQLMSENAVNGNLESSSPIKHSAENIRAVRPCAVIVTGGAGGKILCRLKRKLKRQKTHKFVAFRYLDTDSTVQSDLTDKEFCHVRTSGTINALENPDAHEMLADRFDLRDESVRTTAIAVQDTDQAGQFRLEGCHALLSDYDSVRNSIRSLLLELNSTTSRLEKQLASRNEIRIRDRIRIYLVTSLCGGTGSSMFLQLAALIQELAANMEVEIVPICLTASVFENELQSRPEQWMRVKANTYGTQQEVAAFLEGFGTRLDIELGPNELESLKLNAGFANQLILVGRQTADGRDLGNADAVCDLVATYLAAEIGTEIADQLEMDDANQATLKGLSVDPDTGRPRYLASIGANILCLDIERIASFCTHKAVVSFIDRVMVGDFEDPQSITKLVEAWMSAPAKGVGPLGSVDEQLKCASVPNIDNKLKQSLPQRGLRTRHYRDRQFAAVFGTVRNSINHETENRVQHQMANCESAATKKLDESLQQLFEKQFAERGIDSALAMVKTLRKGLEIMASDFQRRSDSDQQKVIVLDAQLNEVSERLSKRWFGFATKSKSTQIRLVNDLKSVFQLSSSAKTKHAAGRLLDQLSASVVRWEQHLNDARAQAVRLSKHHEQLLQEFRAGRRVTTLASLAEIDISSLQTDKQLYDRFCPNLKTLGPRTSNTRCEWLLKLSVDQDLKRLSVALRQHFEKQLKSINVVDILADQLSNPETEPEARAKIRQAMLTQPAWTANARNNSVQYANTLIAGIPESDNTSKRQLVVEAMMEAASARSNANNQYSGSAKHVVSGDNHNIYVLRRSHGATWHYLPEVKSCFDAYQKWKQSGGHTVHIFNKKTVAKLPPLLQQPKIPVEALTFALGLAYNFIAKRGPQFYWNLIHSEDGNYRCALTSHWPTINSDSSKDHAQLRPLAVLCRDSKVSFEGNDQLDDSLQLGATWSEVVAEFSDRPEYVKHVQRVFDALRARSGDEAVADELENYLEQLRSESLQSSAIALRDRMTEVVSRKIQELR